MHDAQRLGDIILVITLITSGLTIAWTVTRDLASAIGRRRILQHINRSSKTGAELQLFNLNVFDTGVHTDLLFHFSAGASEKLVQLYLEMRGWVGNARQPLRDADFWLGIKGLKRKRKRAGI